MIKEILLEENLQSSTFHMNSIVKALFSTHLDKNKEVVEWSMYDGFVFMGMAMYATIGGFIASNYGFSFLFYLVATTNLLSIIPYILYAKSKGTTEPEHLTKVN